MTLKDTIWLHISLGDKEAYSELYRYLFSKLYNYGAKFTCDEIILEDAVHEVLLLIWNSRDNIQALDYPETYFFSAFRNILFGRIKYYNRQTQELTEVREPEFNIEQIIIKNEGETELKKRLEESIKELTPRQREVIYLRFYEGFSYDKVASVMGITTKASYKAVARALERLKEIMLVGLIFFLCQ